MIADARKLTLLRSPGVPHTPVSVVAKELQVWRCRQRYRAELRRLLLIGCHLIKDIGLELDNAITESRKPFWKQ
jgi:uncharacterized protein YjiS (DUF1127 family)